LLACGDIAPPGDSRYPPKGSEGQKPSDFHQRDSEIVALFSAQDAVSVMVTSSVGRSVPDRK
jgi:hypothetical protein